MATHGVQHGMHLTALGSVTEQTHGLFFGDYFDGLILPILMWKIRPT